MGGQQEKGKGRKRMSSSSSPSSPQRYRGGNSNGGGGGEDQRPRFFDKMVKKMCWQNAEIVPGRHPERWRKDAAGNIVCKRFCNCHGCLCYEYDHILPFSKGLLCFAISLSLSLTNVQKILRLKQHENLLGRNWVSKLTTQGEGIATD